MEVSRINCSVPFRAQVEGRSPLVNGNWAFLEDSGAAAPEKSKKGGFWKKALITLAALIVAGIALSKARGTETIQNIVSKGFKESEGFWNKTKWVLGKAVDKGGEYAEIAYNKTVAPLWKGIKKLFSKAGDGSTPAAPGAGTAAGSEAAAAAAATEATAAAGAEAAASTAAVV